MKKGLKIGFCVIVLLYLILYISYENGYYERINQEKTLMTEEMILKYEEDLANGVDVSQEDYIVERNNYANIYTRMSLKVSQKFENIVDSAIKFLFKKINEAVGE